jgi:hypothetical protein
MKARALLALVLALVFCLALLLPGLAIPRGAIPRGGGLARRLEARLAQEFLQILISGHGSTFSSSKGTSHHTGIPPLAGIRSLTLAVAGPRAERSRDVTTRSITSSPPPQSLPEGIAPIF